MANQRELKMVVALNGRVDNSFTQLGEALTIIGSQINSLSSEVLHFAEDSIQEYTAYDDIMREVQALGEYQSGIIDALDNYNKDIAQTSRYTMAEAGEAEKLMAQMGLGVEEIQTMMPSVMDTATAANIDLADSINYLYFTLNALGQPLEYVTTLSDQMAKASAISAADIDTLGQSLQRLGSGSKYFAGGSSEVLAILGGISKFGEDMQDTNAGTQLRNFMLTLLAPTVGKEKLMAELGVTEEAWSEFESYMDDAGINVTDTAAAMNELGLSVYDTRGKLKPAIQIIGEMRAALDSLGSDKEATAYLGKMFGKRTTITAENLLAALDTIIKYQDQIKYNSAGYTQYMASIMDAGLGGTLRNLHSSWNALQVVVGDTMEPEVNFVATGLTNIVNAVTDLDEAKLSALVGAGEGLAIAGPGLLLTGGAFRMIGWALTPAGKWALGVSAAAIAVGALVKGINKLNEIDLESGFGSMELDTEALTAHVQAIGTEFDSAYRDINNYNGALKTALTNYETASTTLSGKLTTAMITGATLTDEEIGQIEALGSTMGTELLKGIEASFNSNASYLEMLYGSTASLTGNDSIAQTGALFGIMYSSVIDDAKELGRDFGEALSEAMDDGIISGNEYTVIMEKMRKYSEAMAVAAGAENAGEIEKALFNAATISWDSAETFLEDTQAERDMRIAESNAEHAYQVGQIKYWYQQAHEQGIINPFTGKVYTADLEDENSDLSKALADMNAAHGEVIAGIEAGYANVFDATFDAIFGTAGDFAYTFAKNVLADDSFVVGELGNPPRDFDYTAHLPEGTSWQEVAEGLAWMERNFGDFEDMFKGYVSPEKWLEFTGINDWAFELSETAYHFAVKESESDETPSSQQIADEVIIRQEQVVAEKEAAVAEVEAEIRERTNRLNGIGRPIFYELANGYQEDAAALGISDVPRAGGTLYDELELKRNDLAKEQEKLKAFWGVTDSYDTADVNLLAQYGDDFANHALETIESSTGRFGLKTLFESMSGAISADSAFMISETNQEANDLLAQIIDELRLVYDFEKVLANETTFLADPGSAYRDYVATYSLLYGNASRDRSAYYHSELMYNPEGAQTSIQLMMEVPGAKEVMEDALDDMQEVADDGVTVPITFSGPRSNTFQDLYIKFQNGEVPDMDLYADGGRTVKPAIFGDAGPEWAIPEEHSARTASLLIAASEASGFTLQELNALGASLGMDLYADGGRTAKPAIFGDAGPEWAIPEEHSARTASLLVAASEASGFTWPELIGRNGGLNAGRSVPTQIIYSPTIVAKDARGVEQKLIEDKQRLDRWWAEKQLRDEVEVYV